MNTWTVRKDLMKRHYQIKMLFTANQNQKILLIKTMRMLKMCIKN